MTDYGTDLSCVGDVDPAGYEVSGRLQLGQALARRLSTPRGRLLEDANYGIDLRANIDDDMAPVDVARLKVAIEAECLKDERVLACTATLTFSGGVLLITLAVQDGTGPFPLVLGVTNVTTTLLNVGQ